MQSNGLQTVMPRRTLLVVAGASGVLVACGNGSEESEATETPTTASTTPGETASPSPTEAGGQVVATVSEVPVSGGFVNKDLHVVVTQPASGEYKAFSSICTHKGCDVGSVANNVISCPCHGSQFSAETGDVSMGPATMPLAEVTVAVEGDNIVRA